MAKTPEFKISTEPVGRRQYDLAKQNMSNEEHAKLMADGQMRNTSKPKMAETPTFPLTFKSMKGEAE